MSLIIALLHRVNLYRYCFNASMLITSCVIFIYCQMMPLQWRIQCDFAEHCDRLNWSLTKSSRRFEFLELLYTHDKCSVLFNKNLAPVHFHQIDRFLVKAGQHALYLYFYLLVGWLLSSAGFFIVFSLSANCAPFP